MLRIERSEHPRTFLVAGELDFSNSADLAETLDPVAREPGDIVLELSGLEFADSSGIQALIRVARELGARGTLVLRHPGEGVRRVIELMGIERLDNLRVE